MKRKKSGSSRLGKLNKENNEDASLFIRRQIKIHLIKLINELMKLET